MRRDFAGRRLAARVLRRKRSMVALVILALNLNSAMKRLVLGGASVGERGEGHGFWLIELPGHVLNVPACCVFDWLGGMRRTNTLGDAKESFEPLRIGLDSVADGGVVCLRSARPGGIRHTMLPTCYEVRSTWARDDVEGEFTVPRRHQTYLAARWVWIMDYLPRCRSLGYVS